MDILLLSQLFVDLLTQECFDKDLKNQNSLYQN